MPRNDTVSQAEERLQSLSARIDRLKSSRTARRPAMRTDIETSDHDRADYDRAMDALAESWAAAERQLVTLRETGGDQWDSMRSRFNSKLRRLGSLVQRVAETVEPVGGDGAIGRSRYFISPNPEGGWMLKKQDTNLATKYFEGKNEAVRFSRRYVRQKEPSELVIRRRNGTFESIHRYG